MGFFGVGVFYVDDVDDGLCGGLLLVVGDFGCVVVGDEGGVVGIFGICLW